MTLAVLDWGIGGAPTWDAIRKLAPSIDLIYVSDSAYAPYGTVPRQELAHRLGQLGTTLVPFGVTHIAVACNAASVALDELRERPCAFFGIVDDGVEIAVASGAQTIAVLGGKGTIAAAAHERRLRAAQREVIAIAAQPLSAHVEAGRLSGPEVEADVERSVRAAKGADALLLACTHYSALLPVFRQFTKQPILDPCETFARRVATKYRRTQSSQTQSQQAQGVVQGSRRAFCSGDVVRAREAATNAFGIDLGRIRGLVL